MISLVIWTKEGENGGMQALTQLFTVVIFMLSLMAIFSLGVFSKTDSGPKLTMQGEIKVNNQNAQSYFTGVNYYILKNNKPSFHLEANDLTLNSLTKKTIFFRPAGTVYSDDGKRIFYQGRRGQYFAEENLLFLKNEVEVRMNQTFLRSDDLEYNLTKDLIKAKGDVATQTRTEEEHIDITSERMWAKPSKDIADFEGNVKGRIKRMRKYEPPVDFKSNKLHMDLQKSHIELKENVWLKKQEVRATSHSGEIFLKNYNKKLKYFILYDDVTLKEKVQAGKMSFIRKAYGEKLEGLISEEKFILTGYPRVYQQDDVIKGNRIVLRENNEVVEVDDANTRFLLR